MLHRTPWRAGVVAGGLAALLGGCGQATAPGATTSGLTGATERAGATRTAVVSPIPTVEATCIADYLQYQDTAELVAVADVIIRGTATGSRDYDAYPLVSTGTDSAPPFPSTALSVRVTEVVKGDVEVGEVLEVTQNPCTARPLPAGPDTDYVLALSASEPGRPLAQLNDTHAAYQVAGDRALVPVSPENDLGVESIEDLLAAVPPPCTRGWVTDTVPDFTGAADAETALQEWLAADPAGGTGPEVGTPRTGWRYQPTASEDEEIRVNSGWEVTLRRSTLGQWRVTGVSCR